MWYESDGSAIYYKSCACGAVSHDANYTFQSTVVPVFARFDFGTNSKAEALGVTSHEYLVNALFYDENFISVSYTEDTLIMTALQNHPEIITEYDENGDLVEVPGERYTTISYALRFDNLITYEFNDHLTKEKNFMKIRIKNSSTNNIMSFQFIDTIRTSYTTTMAAICMYMQGGAPTMVGDHKLTASPSNQFETYTYDINLLAYLARSNHRGDPQANSYLSLMEYVANGGSINSNHWNWISPDGEVCGLRFYVLGAYGGSADTVGFAYADTRANIVKGATAEIDYIIFGMKDNIDSYTSYMEDAEN